MSFRAACSAQSERGEAREIHKEGNYSSKQAFENLKQTQNFSP